MVVVASEHGVRLWSRQRVDLTDRFPDVADAASFVPPGTVVDGEAVAWNGDRLDFDLLQKRLVAPMAKAAALRRRHPTLVRGFRRRNRGEQIGNEKPGRRLPAGLAGWPLGRRTVVAPDDAGDLGRLCYLRAGEILDADDDPDS